MTTSILARFTKAHQPAVFLLDSLDAKRGEIKVWEGSEEPPRTVGLDYYRNTVPVSDAVESELVEKFRRAFNPPGGIVLRKRLWKVNPDHPSFVPPTAKHEEASTTKLINTHTPPKPVAASQHAATLEEKVAAIESITAAFSKAMNEAVAQIMKS